MVNLVSSHNFMNNEDVKEVNFTHNRKDMSFEDQL